MLLESVTLKDYSVFRGTHRVQLSPDPTRPSRNIVLIGGRNGSGKTSLLEAIRLCLYGPQVLNHLGKRQTYEDYVRARANRELDLDADADFGVTVDFTYTLRGKETQFQVSRNWQIAGERLRESLEVRRDGLPLPDVEMDHWQQFLNELIPPGVTQFFFFDAEQIQYLARDGDVNTYLIDAINALLDIDILDRLDGDLDNLARKLRHEAGPPTQRAVQEARHAVERKQAEIQIIRDQLTALAAQEKKTIESRVRLEKSLHKQGITLGLDRKQLQEEVGVLQESIRRATADLQSLYASTLPLVCVPHLTSVLRHQIEAERRRRAWDAARVYAEQLAARIADELASHPELQTVPQAARERLIALYRERWQQALATPPADAQADAFLRLGEVEEERVLKQLSELPNVVAQFRTLVQSRVRAESRLAQVQAQLAKAPQGSRLELLLRELSEHDRTLGAIQANRERLNENLKEGEVQLRPLLHQLAEAEARDTANSHVARKQQMVDKVRSVLEQFRSSVLARKARELQTNIAEMLHRLARKADLLRDLRLDPKTYEMELLGRRGQEIPKEQLSAGEKQIFAISVLWGLAQTSGRRLPIIIDTPLGRLDSAHRRAIVEHYLPRASHQVIVLSTDTELDEAYYGLVERHVAHAYHLDYESEDKGTRIEEGYFWRSPREAEA